MRGVTRRHAALSGDAAAAAPAYHRGVMRGATRPLAFALALGAAAVPVPPSGACPRPPLVFVDFEVAGAVPVLDVLPDAGPPVRLPLGLKGGAHHVARQLAPSPVGPRVAVTSFDAVRSGWRLLVWPSGGRARELDFGVAIAQPAWSRDGRSLAYVDTTGRPLEWQLEAVAAHGGPPVVLGVFGVSSSGELRDHAHPEWSPAGDVVTVAGELPGGDGVILAADPATPGPLRQLFTARASGILDPAWSPDGSRIAFEWFDRSIGGRWVLSTVGAEGGPAERVTVLSGGGAGEARWSPDGSRLAFVDYDYALATAVLRVVPADGSAPPTTVAALGTGITGGHPQWSALGDRLAYGDFESGSAVLKVVALEGCLDGRATRAAIAAVALRPHWTDIRPARAGQATEPGGPHPPAGRRPADFDGDGRPDALEQQPLDGALGLRLGDGRRRPLALPRGWAVAATGDLDGDGRSDLVLRRPETGEAAFWLLDGTRVRRRLRATVPGGHVLAGVEDRDGDGRDEVRWIDGEGRTTVTRLAPAR